ncbi:hypothetical protein K438DRAFT_1043054 [Mycena galopus ATCC 62051]|nr:hypothetical protein K438DRAFT_1043054 [Mycena galopus ATCC 62051]
MQLGPLSAFVTVDGVPLAEYAIEYSADGLEATCWIPSQTEKNFCIQMMDTDASPNRLVSGRITVDGLKCGGLCLVVPRRSKSRNAVASRHSVSTSPSTRRPLRFTKQILTDDDAYLNTTISPKQGTIEVVFNLVKRQPANRPRTTWFKPDEPRMLHERSKKALGHSVQFGPEFHRTQSKYRAYNTKIIKCLAKLIFRYRPIELLQAGSFVPRERVMAPTGVDVVDLSMEVDEEDIDQAEIEKLEKQLDSFKTQLDALKKKGKKPQVKREPCDVKKEVKREEPIFTPGEVIDLT